MHDPTNKFQGEISPQKEKVAKIISFLGQPPFLAIIPFVSICMVYTDDAVKGALCSLVAVFAAVILPISIIIYFSKKFKNEDKLDVERREDRYIPLIAGVTGYAIGVVLLYLLEAPFLAIVLMICYTVVTAAMTLITFYWKISIHACGVIGPSMGLAMAFWPFGLIYFLWLPPIAWSRYVLKKHTPMQLAMGALLGFVLTAAIFWIML